MYKTTFFRMAALAFAGILAGSCSAPETDGVSYGTLDFGSLSVTARESGITEVVTRAVSTDDFILTITSPGGNTAGQWAVAELPESVTLPTGNYKVGVISPEELKDADWDCPWYAASEDFAIDRDQATQLNVVCRMANIKVTVSYDSSLDAVLDPDAVTTVEIDGNSLGFARSETRAGYFRAASEPVDMTVTLTGIINGTQEAITQTFNGVSAGEWQNVTFKYQPVVRSGVGIGAVSIELSSM